MSSFDRSSSSEEEFFDACSGDEKSCEELDSLTLANNEDNQQQLQLQQQLTNDELFSQPKAPPRKKKIKKVNSFNKNDQAKDAYHLKIDNNITNYVDDIASIQGDLSVTDAYVLDRKSVHVEDLKRKDISDDLINKVVEENRLKDSQLINKTTKDNIKSFFKQADDKKLDASTTKESNVIKDTIKEDDEKSVSSNCINPINLRLLKITNDYDSDEETVEDDERNSQVTEKITDNLDSLQDNQPLKKEPLKNTVKNLKKFGQGFMKGVQKVKNSASSSNQKGDLNNCTNIAAAAQNQQFESDYFQQQQQQQQQQNQFKFKSNKKKEPAEFDSLKIIQELNDCKGAIWCMKWSVCGKLLAVAGKDQLLRVYCCYSAWKYFTQMRSNASSSAGGSGSQNQISPNSTKERSFSGSRHSISSLNNDNLSFESVLHSNSFSKFMNEDNILSEEGPLLLFSAYNGHKADVLDIAWSKNHFLLSSSMDKNRSSMAC